MTEDTLPPLRQDLALHPGPAAPDGAPTWTLHDPAVNRFYELHWPAFEVLSRWALGSVRKVVSAVRRETTLSVDASAVAALRLMLAQNHLLQARSAQDSEHLGRVAQAGRLSVARWLLAHYLFLRLPLVRPMHWLQRLAPHLGWAYRPAFWVTTAVVAVLALGLVGRRWDEFTHTFTAYANWSSALSVALALAFAKLLHEFGHAFTAYRYGCRVGTMGVAFLVLWPVLYTDTNEAWKLSSRRQRLAIGAAGMLSEAALAAYATLAWALLPETPAWGPVRAAAFQLATVTWLITLAVNASPFLRFDGYFLLSDALNLPNLHERSFALARWWLRERLFAWGDAPPESFSRGRTRFLVGFGFVTWVYRLILFVAIALVVYHLFFKALGLLLMGVELAWFVARPVLRELKTWMARRRSMRWNHATRRLAVLLIAAISVLCWPWQATVRAPAVLGALHAQAVYAPHAAQVSGAWPHVGQRLKQDEAVVQLHSPALQARLNLAMTREQRLRWQAEQQALDPKLMEAGPALRKRWEAARQEVEGLRRQVQRLTLTMPFEGVVIEVSDDASTGSWVPAGEQLALVAGGHGVKVEAFVDEGDLRYLRPDATATFIADGPERQRVRCTRTEIDAVQSSELGRVAAASVYGGSLPSQRHTDGRVVALQPTFRVRLDGCDVDTPPISEVAGVALLHSERRSVAMRAFEWSAALLQQAWGF